MNITTPDWVQDAVFYQIFPDRLPEAAVIRPELYRSNPGTRPPPRMATRAVTCTGSQKSWIT